MNVTYMGLLTKRDAREFCHWWNVRGHNAWTKRNPWRSRKFVQVYLRLVPQNQY